MLKMEERMQFQAPITRCVKTTFGKGEAVGVNGIMADMWKCGEEVVRLDTHTVYMVLSGKQRDWIMTKIVSVQMGKGKRD